MKYEFAALDQFISKGLSSFTDRVEVASFIRYLKQRFSYCGRQHLLYFNLSSHGSYELTQRRSRIIFEAAMTLPNAGASPANVALKATLLKEASLHIPSLKASTQSLLIDLAKDAFLLDLLEPIEFEELTPAEASYYFYHTYIQREISEIKKNLTGHVFTLGEKKQIKLYLHTHQAALQTLLQAVRMQLDEKSRKSIYDYPLDYSLSDIYKMLYTGLESIQSYLETHFTSYINTSLLLPYNKRLLSAAGLTKTAQSVYTHLVKSPVDTTLRRLLEIPLKKMLSVVVEEQWSYEDLFYHKKLLITLEQAFKGQPALSEESVLDILFTMNYNSLDFFDYLTTRIGKSIEGYQGTAKIAQLYYLNKVYRQKSMHTRMRYKKTMPPIKEQVLDYLAEEIIYQEKMLHIQADELKISYDESSKLTTGLSVGQLAYLFRILQETGVIGVKSGNELFRFLQSNFSSKRQETISIHTLSNKYYNVEESTRKAVKEVVIKLLNHINKTKG